MEDLISGLKLGVKLGNGHFGEVFLGQDDLHGNVAVKIISRKNHQSDAEWLSQKAAFLSEGKFLSRAEHQNVVKVHHLTESSRGDYLCLCMALCSGGSLQTQYEKAPINLGICRKVTTDILFGLNALHSRGMLHRDIKPGNILLDLNGNALLGDFGLVTDDIVLGYGSQAGYLDHIAYEVWLGNGTSAKSDIWAFGMTVYRLLHGKFWYDLFMSTSRPVSDGGFAQSLSWLPSIPQSWRRYIKKCMHDDTSLRFQTASQALGAVSLLPAAPCWDTEFTSESVVWKRIQKSRQITVEWSRPKNGRHHWTSKSSPILSGKSITLASSGGEVTPKDARKSLELYFQIDAERSLRGRR